MRRPREGVPFQRCRCRWAVLGQNGGVQPKNVERITCAINGIESIPDSVLSLRKIP